jgi:predicted membrane metal-binding protein/glyoxylase-like metal-dependent hydrolase (beta-lactamase superfamily II)
MGRSVWTVAGWAFVIAAGLAWPHAAACAAWAGTAALTAGLCAVAALAARAAPQRQRELLSGLGCAAAAAALAVARTPSPAPAADSPPSPVRIEATMFSWHRDRGSEGWGRLGEVNWEGAPQSSRLPTATILVAGSWLGRAALRPGQRVTVEGVFEVRAGQHRMSRALLREAAGGRWMPLAALRQRVHERLHDVLPPEEAGFAVALLIGAWSEIAPQHAESYRRFGLLHLLAVSGLHLWLWDALLRRGLPRSLQFLRMPGVTLMAALAGFGPAVLRAWAALALRDFAHRRARGLDPFRIWSAALFLEVAFFAPERQGLGFLLSYSATGALLAAPSRPGAHVALRALQMSCAGFLGSAPWLASAQGTLEPWSIPFSPIFGLLLPVRILLACVALLPGCGAACGVALAGLSEIEQGTFALISALPGAPWPVTNLLPGAILLAAGLGLVALRAGTARRPWRAASALLAAGALLLVRYPHAPGLLALPVGHGLGIVVCGAQRTLIYDLGSRRASSTTVTDRILFPELLRRRWPAPDRCVQSHADADHAAGLELLRRRGLVREVRVSAGEEILLDGLAPFQVRVLGCRAAVAQVRNAAGPVLEVRAERAAGGEFRAVLLGDQFGYALRELRARLDPGPVDLLLLPHHGLTTDGCLELLDHLLPREAWASCDAANLPLPIAAACARRGIPLRTTSAGALHLDGFAVTTAGTGRPLPR